MDEIVKERIIIGAIASLITVITLISIFLLGIKIQEIYNLYNENYTLEMTIESEEIPQVYLAGGPDEIEEKSVAFAQSRLAYDIVKEGNGRYVFGSGGDLIIEFTK